MSLDDPNGPSNRVSVLLLEKLGGRMPLNQNLDDVKYA